MVTVYSPLTWGVFTNPPPDIPECGFVGEFCLPPIQGKLVLLTDNDWWQFAAPDSASALERCWFRLTAHHVISAPLFLLLGTLYQPVSFCHLGLFTASRKHLKTHFLSLFCCNCRYWHVCVDSLLVNCFVCEIAVYNYCTIALPWCYTITTMCHGECAHAQHVRRTLALTLTLTHTITAYWVRGNVVRVCILICTTRH